MHAVAASKPVGLNPMDVNKKCEFEVKFLDKQLMAEVLLSCVCGSVRVRNRVLLLPHGLRCEAWIAHGDVRSHFCRFKKLSAYICVACQYLVALCQMLGD